MKLARPGQPSIPGLPAGMVQPITKIVLKRKVEDIKWVVVTETPAEVKDLVNNATERLVTVTRVLGMKPSEYHLNPDNVDSVESWS